MAIHEGWPSLRDDILTFAKLMGMSYPTPWQQHYLLRVQRDDARLGMHHEFPEMFQVICISMMWRALCWGVPSYTMCEDPKSGESWVTLMRHAVAGADSSIKYNVQVAKTGRFLKVNGVRVSQVITPFVKLDEFHAGMQDLLLLDFDQTPRFRVDDIFELAKGAILYLPIKNETPDGALVQRKHG